MRIRRRNKEISHEGFAWVGGQVTEDVQLVGKKWDAGSNSSGPVVFRVQPRLGEVIDVFGVNFMASDVFHSIK